MYKCLNIIVLLFFSVFLFAQPYELKLPKGGEPIKVEQVAPIFRFYITKDHEVYFEKKRLRYLDEIASNILQAQRGLIESWRADYIKIYIYADFHVNYYLIDSIKTEIANTPGFNFVYLITEKTNNLENGIFNRIFFTGEFKFPIPILTKEEENKSKEINEEIKDIPPPPLPPLTMKDELVYNIFSGNKNGVENIISNFSVDFILLSKDIFSFESSKYSLSNTKKLKEILESTDLLFLKFDNKLVYGDYINALQSIKRLITDIGEKDLEKKPMIVEMTIALEELLNKENIQIFNLKD